MNIDLSGFTLEGWIDGMLTILGLPLTGTFMANIALVGCIMLLLFFVIVVSQSFGTDEDAPFDI